MPWFSRKLKDALLMDRKVIPNYRRAQLHGLDPFYLSKAIHGGVNVKRSDQRIISLGRDLGLEAHECFEDSATALGKCAPTATALQTDR